MDEKILEVLTGLVTRFDKLEMDVSLIISNNKQEGVKMKKYSVEIMADNNTYPPIWQGYEVGDDGFAYGETEEEARWAVEEWFAEHGSSDEVFRLSEVFEA